MGPLYFSVVSLSEDLNHHLKDTLPEAMSFVTRATRSFALRAAIPRAAYRLAPTSIPASRRIQVRTYVHHDAPEETFEEFTQR
jgi:hypothetical protein